MWLTLVAALGMAILIVPVVRARHELAAPLGALIADMLVWNLSWLAHQLSGNEQWLWLSQTAASLVMVLGLDFVLTFVGRRRALAGIRRLAYYFYGICFASSASRFIIWEDTLYLGDALWQQLMYASRVATATVIAWLLISHFRSQADRAERAHTRLLMIGMAVWLILATTDLVHHRLAVVPQLSAVGMLFSAGVMTVVMDRVRSGRASTWWVLYTISLFVVALCGNFLVFKTLPTTTAMLLARTVMLSVVGVAAVREVVTMVVRRKQKMADLALVGRVTAQMAHDLQNPLAAIKCATQIIEEDRLRGGSLDAARREKMLAVVARQVDRLSGIIDDYRRVGRIEPRSESVSLTHVIDRIATPNNVIIEVDLRSRRIVADGELVARALDNLVRNAAEAMPEGGTVRVSAHSPANGWVELTVADQGPGMDARVCERAFDDFFTTKAKGSGLGLAFVRRVAEAHGGVASISSRIGRGTDVTLRLPAEIQPELCLTESVRAAA